MAGLFDGVGEWARAQGKDLGKAYGGWARSQLGAEQAMRGALQNIPARLAERLALESAPRRGAPQAVKLRGPVQPEPLPRSIQPGLPGSGAELEYKNDQVRLGSLAPEMSRLYPDIVDTWRASGGPRPVITSGNDSTHGRNSLHYRDRALDLRGNNVDPRTANEILNGLRSRVGADYDVLFETYPNNPSNNHFHIEYDPKPPR